jgi:MFS superfamily sulfate permease-like transporter
MKRFFKHYRSDLPASVVVLLVALPLCLGIALGSKAPLFSGIIAGIAGGVVVGLVSRSQLSVSGPAAGLTVIVATAISSLPSFEAFLASVVIAGVLQVLLGFARAGMLGDYVPNSVIKGMLAAIGIILILKQLPHLVGYDHDFEGDENFSAAGENTFSALLNAASAISPAACLIGTASLAILIVWELPSLKRVKPLQMVPAPLLVVVVGIMMARFLSGSLTLAPEHFVNLPISGSLRGFVELLSFPDFSKLSLTAVWTSGITLAIVASLETLLSIEAVDKLDPYRRVTPTDRELKAQGLGNIVSGLLGGLPVTSVIVRSSANVNAGARTRLSAVMHGVLMFVSVITIPGLLNSIPLSALAAILIFTGYKLAKWPMIREFYDKGWDQFIPFAATILAILLTDLLTGILIGIFIGLFFVMRSNFRSAVFVVNDGSRYMFRLRKDVSFLNKPLVKYKLERVPEGSYVIIDATRADFIDKDVIDVINEFMAHAHLKGITVEVKKSLYKPMHLLFRNPRVDETTDADA